MFGRNPPSPLGLAGLFQFICVSQSQPQHDLQHRTCFASLLPKSMHWFKRLWSSFNLSGGGIFPHSYLRFHHRFSTTESHNMYTFHILRQQRPGVLFGCRSLVRDWLAGRMSSALEGVQSQGLSSELRARRQPRSIYRRTTFQDNWEAESQGEMRGGGWGVGKHEKGEWEGEKEQRGKEKERERKRDSTGNNMALVWKTRVFTWN